MDPTEAGRAFSRAGLSDSVRPTPRLSQQGNSRIIDHQSPATEEEVAGDDGLDHHGDLEVEVVDDEEPEMEVLEEGRPEDGRGEGPRVLKAPRAPYAAGDRRPYGDAPAPRGMVRHMYQRAG